MSASESVPGAVAAAHRPVHVLRLIEIEVDVFSDSTRHSADPYDRRMDYRSVMILSIIIGS